MKRFIVAIYWLIQLKIPANSYFLVEGSDYLMTPFKADARKFYEYKDALDIQQKQPKGLPITIEFYKD